ncbi:hypothetical protein EJ08DRAFT_700014 [Tothia fuscella]|uniref:Uncharacterized protein n=1 Tax=Tothia fuscella TaxID=1048955 RepID=A0A9P4NL98_9PEZI|nr:hypothetical protein EJ08DRAFT_700014 [Tothia fuscella]
MALNFAYEGVILPDNQPLMLVHRDWRQHNRSPVDTSARVAHRRGLDNGRNKLRRKFAKTRSAPPALALRTENSTPDAGYEQSREGFNSLTFHFLPDSSSNGGAFKAPTTVAINHYIAYYLHTIADSLYPFSERLTFNPIRERCFKVAVTNETWFLTIMYCSARSLASSECNSIYANDATLLMDRIVGRLQNSVADAEKGILPSDAIICAIACLATLESGLDNLPLSQAHRRGLAELVRARGGIKKIDKDLRYKVHRADIESAVDTNALPLLAYTAPSKTSIPLAAFRGSTYLGSHLYENLISHLHPILAQIAKDISELSFTLEHSFHHAVLLNPYSLDEDATNIQHALLTCYSTDFEPLDHAGRIAALVYVKSLLRPMSTLAKTSKILCKQLADTMVGLEDGSTILARWIAFMGLMSSLPGSAERDLFTSKVNQCGWEETKTDLKKILWVDAIHSSVAKEIWSEVWGGVPV